MMEVLDAYPATNVGGESTDSYWLDVGKKIFECFDYRKGKITDAKANQKYIARCVKGEKELVATCAKLSDGTSTCSNGLMLQTAYKDVASHKEAIDYCNSSSVAGYSHWHLVNTKEASIVHYLSREHQDADLGHRRYRCLFSQKKVA
ncbi:MAG: hypothetical protein CSA19_00495 [Deltaproteobacteria bacterium]|nr:MAG: hypothetical protein CSA19_00495 [Deltaproteobacteria bacterium]